jgi:hypothetical protein
MNITAKSSHVFARIAGSSTRHFIALHGLRRVVLELDKPTVAARDDPRSERKLALALTFAIQPELDECKRIVDCLSAAG